LVAALDIVFLRDINPWTLLGLELYFLDAVAAGVCPPVLLFHQTAGRLVSIGRYHLYAGPAQQNGISVVRRLTGGRVIGAGEGWFGCALILPTRHALLERDTAGLKPEQVMNRYTRGALAALRSLGVECFYPGRDAITAERRELAMCCFETDSHHALLFEFFLAVNRGMDTLVYDLERLDPDGALTSAMYNEQNATTLVRELRRDLGGDDLVAAMSDGYSGALGEVRPRKLTTEEISQGEHRAGALSAGGWLNDRRADPSMNRIARAQCQLGFIEARLKLGADDKIERVALSGDFIANSPGIAEFEADLVSKPLDFATLSKSVVKVFGDGSNYFLGIGDLSALPQLVLRAQ
jgi:lipoate-protein ligase A